MKCAMITGGTNENTLCLEHHFGQKIELFEENGTPVHPNMSRVHQELMSKLNVDESFFQR